MDFDKTQLDAIEHAVKAVFTVITGGAGTGKTTIMHETANRLEAAGKKVLLCAFAGKAAARLKEATKREATTIHRMLGFNGMRFLRESLKGWSVIVDEASMVDSELMVEIVMRKPDKLILVGDDAQLPPVGKGQPFHDIIALRPDVVCKLDRCYRATEAVFRAATAIRHGEQVRVHEVSANEHWRIVQTGDEAATHAAIIAQVKAGFFDFDQDIILCPKNGDESMLATVDALNMEIAAIVNPRRPDQTFVAGDRVMNTKNNADKDIWNGTTGEVASVNMDGGVHLILDEPVIDYKRSTEEEIIYKNNVSLTKEESKHLKLAYALTVHKSQGSQYRKVVFVCLMRDLRILTRNLIYTAVTRTREQCVVVGSQRVFVEGCQAVTKKQTVLQQLAMGVATEKSLTTSNE